MFVKTSYFAHRIDRVDLPIPFYCLLHLLTVGFFRVIWLSLATVAVSQCGVCHMLGLHFFFQNKKKNSTITDLFLLFNKIDEFLEGDKLFI